MGTKVAYNRKVFTHTCPVENCTKTMGYYISDKEELASTTKEFMIKDANERLKSNHSKGYHIS